MGRLKLEESYSFSTVRFDFYDLYDHLLSLRDEKVGTDFLISYLSFLISYLRSTMLHLHKNSTAVG